SIGGISKPRRLAVLRLINQLEFRRLDYRQVGRFGTFEDAARINAHQSVRFGVTWSVTRQAADLCELAPQVECRKLIVVGERHNLLCPIDQEWIRAQEQRVWTLARYGHERSVDLALVGRLEHLDFLTHSTRRRLLVPQTIDIDIGRIVQQGDRRGGWN